MVRVAATPSSSYEEKIRYLAHTEDDSGLEKQVIRKVPLMLRNREKLLRYFEPRGVSLGPIHYGQRNLEPAEELKAKLATDFIKSSGCTVEELYGLVEANIEELALCYSEEFRGRFPFTELAWILFVDGWSILHFIHHVVHPHHQILKKLNIKNDLVAFAQQDAFLLENQVPFKLLDLLMSKNQKGETLRKAIVRFVGMNLPVTPKSDKDVVALYPPPLHLLDLLRRALLMGGEKPAISRDEEAEEEWPTFRNVQKLQTTGIYVKRCETRKGLGIEFKPGPWGMLEIPGIIMDDSTQPQLLNLVAYEMCPEFRNDFEVTSYICLLDSLIDQAEDVKELRKENVILNLLGSDEQLANIFNIIATDLVPNSEIYSEVKKEMQEHVNTSYKKWMAEAYHKYFSSPWSFLAFLGAVMGLVLTFSPFSPSSMHLQALLGHGWPCDKKNAWKPCLRKVPIKRLSTNTAPKSEA